MRYPALYWEDIEEGQDLPAITYELSLLRLIAFVRATGVYDYIHFDRDYAQLVGARDVFAATPHIAGLFSRLITDWAGPGADIRSMIFSMRGQSCAGDILRLTGKVGRKYRTSAGDCLVDLADLNIAHALAPQAAVATATLAVPSRDNGPVKAGDPAASPMMVPAPNPDIPDFARPLLGQRKEITQRRWPVGEDEIHLWCEALEDWNPLYWDRDYATASRHGGVIAPPLALLYGPGSSAAIGVGYLKPGETLPQSVKRGLTGIELLQETRKEFVAANAPLSLPEFPEVIISDSRVDCYRPLYPGDSVRTVQEMLDCGPQKRTRLGEGHFLTWQNADYNQHDELLKTVRYTMFCYRTREMTEIA